MKRFLMNISAAILVVWYCMSIIGFDVHTCMSSGRTFVATFADGVACADIHPEHHCCCASCQDSHHHDLPSCCSSDNDHKSAGEHHDSESIDVKSCCSNEYQAIQLSGCRTDNDERYFSSKAFLPCVMDIPVQYIAMTKYHADHIQFLDPDSGVLPPGEHCATFGVWRI